jgi:hypothetical protein
MIRTRKASSVEVVQAHPGRQFEAERHRHARRRCARRR